MTTQEIAKVAEDVRMDRQLDYVPDDLTHDQYGHAKDHNTFDSRHSEDVFPY